MHLPALEGTKIGRFTRVFTDIGDEQSIAQNASTFSAHLRRLAEIVSAADDRTLILIDEIGSGTEPSAGAALAVAILERFLASGARVIATTHATELKLFAHQTGGVQNASVRFNPQTYAPTFELDVGSPGQSLAFALARTIGLDEGVVARGEHLLSNQERDYDRAVAELAEIRTKAAAERTELARELERVRTAQSDARREANALEAQRRTFAREADERLARTLREFTAELARRAGDRGGRGRVTPGQSILLTRTLDEIHRELGLEATRQTGEAPAHLEPGERVHVLSLDRTRPSSKTSAATRWWRSARCARPFRRPICAKAAVRPSRSAHAATAAQRRRSRTSPRPGRNSTCAASASSKRSRSSSGGSTTRCSPAILRCGSSTARGPGSWAGACSSICARTIA